MGIRDNLRRVQDEVHEACYRAGRPAADVRLMAVSKTHPASDMLEAYACGQRFFGENRVQEMQSKVAELGLAPDLQVHLIGPLQNNKTSKAAELFHGVDTVDAEKTAVRLSHAAAALGKTLPVLIEVKLSPEPTKHGVEPAALSPLLEAISPLPCLSVQGLLTVAPLEAVGEQARPFFRQLRTLRDALQARFPTLQELSMGMSGDFAAAIEEGSTMVRIGTAIFGSRS